MGTRRPPRPDASRAPLRSSPGETFNGGRGDVLKFTVRRPQGCGVSIPASRAPSRLSRGCCARRRTPGDGAGRRVWDGCGDERAGYSPCAVPPGTPLAASAAAGAVPGAVGCGRVWGRGGAQPAVRSAGSVPGPCVAGSCSPSLPSTPGCPPAAPQGPSLTFEHAHVGLRPRDVRPSRGHRGSRPAPPGLLSDRLRLGPWPVPDAKRTLMV